jgi:hypothetical protein
LITAQQAAVSSPRASRISRHSLSDPAFQMPFSVQGRMEDSTHQITKSDRTVRIALNQVDRRFSRTHRIAPDWPVGGERRREHLAPDEADGLGVRLAHLTAPSASRWNCSSS